MKKVLLFTLLLLWINGLQAQRLKHSRAYLGAILQDSRPGASIILSYGINQYIGIGAGIDLTSYVNKGYSSANKEAKFFAPFYADLRFKYPLPFLEPFVFGQFGKPAYTEQIADFTDVTGASTYKLQQSGKLFYGAGLGLSTTGMKVGLFASVTYRLYKFKYSPDDIDINGRAMPGPKDKEMLLISAGLVF